MFDRNAVLSLAALALISFGVTSPIQGQTDTTSPGISIQNPGTYTFSVGDAQITSLSDGTVPQDVHALLHGTTKENTDALLGKSYLANPVETSLNAFLLKFDGRIVLIDTGVGQLFGPGYGGKLLESLSAAGVSPDQVTDVLLTHMHLDHEGGLVHDGQIVFPNATVHVAKADLDFFLDRSNAAKAHYDEKYFDHAFKTVKLYVDAGKVKSFSGTEEIMPGVTGTVHPGHTPGSVFYTVQSKGQKIVFVGDIVHVAAVQFPDPSITIEYDVDMKQAAQTRVEAFSTIARDRTLIAVPHLPFPGVGHIRAVGNGYEWVPVEYANRSAK
jgi:glyoxylase-like metal-dependent hydrolase (beta-lactamase superfamily II)